MHQPAEPAPLKSVPELLAVASAAGDTGAANTDPAVAEPKPPDAAGFPNKDPSDDDTVASPTALALVAASGFSREAKLGAPAVLPKAEEPAPKTEEVEVEAVAGTVEAVAEAAESPRPEAEAEADSGVAALCALAKNPTGGEPAQ